MFIDVWEMRLTEARSARNTLETQIKGIEGQIESLLDRIVESSSLKVVSAYEKRIEKLEREKIMLSEQADESVPSKGHLSEFIEPAMTFLSSPWNINKNGGLAIRRTVLKLAFSEPLRYSRKTGHATRQ